MFFRTSVGRIVLLYWLISEISVEGFLCKNGKSISDSYFCDSDINDCGDGSDEGYGCDRQRCGPGKFSCVHSPECVPITVHCDGPNDCSDGSDEEDCDYIGKVQVNPENCTLSDGAFLCQNGNLCITFDRMCDGVCNCGDCSDENNVNCYTYDGNSCRACPNRCWPSPTGPQCVCNSNNSESIARCQRFQECTTEDHCEENCIRYDFRITQCQCPENFRGVPGTNGSECQSSASYENILLYSTFSKLKALNLTTNQVQVIKPNVVNCTALSASLNSSYYASFRNDKAIVFEIPNTSGRTRKIIETDTIITSLAVDWITENIYFTNDGSVSVCINNGSICVQLDCCDVDHVVLAPKFGWMYYTEKSIHEHERIIVKSNMDGSEKNGFFIDGSFSGCSSLAIDEIRETLYWYEPEDVDKEKIHSISVHGFDRRTQRTINGILSPFVTALDGIFFFTKRKVAHDNVIYYYRYVRTKDFQDYRDPETNVIKNLYAFNNFFRNISKVENPCLVESCNGLCLIRPSSTSNRLNFTCILCQNHTFKNGTRWCSRSSEQPIEKIDSIPESEPVVPRLLQNSTTSTISTAYYMPTYHPTNSILPTTRMVTQSTIAVTELFENCSSANNASISSAPLSPTQGSENGGFLMGIFIGVVFTIAIQVFYSVFKSEYRNKNRRQASVSELTTL